MSELTNREKQEDFAQELREKNKEINSIDFASAWIKRFRKKTVKNWTKPTKK